jgi:hypothetical protein
VASEFLTNTAQTRVTACIRVLSTEDRNKTSNLGGVVCLQRCIRVMRFGGKRFFHLPGRTSLKVDALIFLRNIDARHSDYTISNHNSLSIPDVTYLCYFRRDRFVFCS